MPEHNATDIDWASLVFDPAFMSAVDKLADRRFGGGPIAEEASTYVIEYLSADDWRKCRQFQGNSKPTTFLYTLASNAIEEFSRKRFGRPRPPKWLDDLGDLWVKLWRSLCLERQLLPSLVDRYSAKGFRDPDAVTQAAKVIKARIPNCGQANMDSVGVEDISAVSDAEQSLEPQTDQDHANPFYKELLLMVNAVTNEKLCCDSFSEDSLARVGEMAASSQSKLDSLRVGLTLSDEERIMLRMVYVEGLSKTATSKALGMPAHQAGRAISNVLDRIAKALEGADIDIEAVFDVMQ